MLKRLFNPNPSFNNNNMPNNPMNNGMPMYENYDLKRLETELEEANRQIKELTKKVNRLENYLGINQNQKYYY